MATLFERQRSFVNREISMKLKGKKTTNRQRAMIFRNAWREAKRKFKD